MKSYIKHGNKLIILYQVLTVSRDRGKPVRDLTGLICFFYNKMDSVLKMSLSIEYHTKSDPPLIPLQNWFEPIVKYSKMFVCDLSNQISLGGQQQEQRGISPFFLWRVEKRIEILIEISLCHCRVHSVLWAPPTQFWSTV